MSKPLRNAPRALDPALDPANHAIGADDTGRGVSYRAEASGRQHDNADRDLNRIAKQMGLDFDDLDTPSDGLRTFSNEDEIIRYAVGMSHHLMPWKDMSALDPDAPESFETTKARFLAFLSPSSKIRADVGRGENWVTGCHSRAKMQRRGRPGKGHVGAGTRGNPRLTTLARI